MATGVNGHVVKLTGNFMPVCGSQDRKHSTYPHQNVSVIALRAPIFKEELQPHSSSLQSIESHPKFIKITQTNSEGEYQFDLPVDLEVTIVAWINNKPYLNLYKGQGEWAFIKVPHSGYITFDIEDTMDAVW